MVRYVFLLFCLSSSTAWADGDVARGATLYQGSCSACHGPNADGKGPAAPALKPPPTDFTAADWWTGRTDTQIRIAIQSGTPGTSMMPFQFLTSQQVEDLVAFLRSKAPKAVDVPQNPPPPKTP